MYTQFFNLKQAPFSIAPDPRYLFMTERHREALAHLLYGVGSGGGFVLLTGEIGAGKTTICRCFLGQAPANCNVAYIFNPKLTVNDLLQSICDDFRTGFQHDDIRAASVKEYVDDLNAYLLAAHAEGRNSVLIIDEAQNLSADVLEQLRLLTNLETNERKLLQIILIGQPELRAMLARPDLEQLAQRVIARYHLKSLSPTETAGYIRHRLSVAGVAPAQPFKPQVLKRIHQLTRGVPRRINSLCDRALLGAYAEGKREVDRRMLNKAAAEVFGDDGTSASAKPQHWRYALWGTVAAVALIVAGTLAANSGWYMKTAKTTQVVSREQVVKQSKATQPSAAAATTVADSAELAPVNLSNEDKPAAQINPIPWDMDDPSITGLRDRNDAIRQLGLLWGVSLNDDLPCLLAQTKDLHCYISNSTGLAEIRQLNRPAILTLHDDADRVYYALLTGLTSTHASLRIGNAIQTISLAVLVRRFRGGFVTFWRAPYAYRELVGLGYRGEETNWIAAQLAKLHGEKAPATHRIFNKKMARLIREFQLEKSLQVDGIVGPKTYMHLNRIAGLDEPFLRGRGTTAIISSGE